MLFLRMLLILAAALAATPVLAEPAPIIAPAPAWVQPMTIPAGNPKLADKPLQFLLMAPQSHYGADGITQFYVESAIAVQNPTGLTAIGNIVLPWQPDQSELFVHKVQIIRAGKAIDLLAGGREFMVLRRESNLESAMLDGMLTAVMQPEGLSVGDIVNVAYSVRTKAGAVPFRGENLFTLSPGAQVRLLAYREIWEDGTEMHWRATAALGTPKVKKTRWGTELLLDLRDADGPEPPAGAPPRFLAPARLELSQYRDWNEIGRILTPLYAAARTLKPDSPLKAEIERIKLSSPDPKTRAMSALRLVQDRIRYLALNMGEGGYVPASADQSWSRKFGDCKGKTVTLLALLDGLGISAQPVLVSTGLGDSLADRLPQVRVFDHVLVRAVIEGKSYWLDGTRLGDRRIEDLASSVHGWGLPVTAEGAPLVRIPLTPPELPIMEAHTTFDASAGFDHPVPVTGQVILRGDAASSTRQLIARMGREAMLEQARATFAENGGTNEVTSFDVKDDDPSGAIVLVFGGKSNMHWPRIPGAAGYRYRFSEDALQLNLNFERKAGPFKEVPFALPFPAFLSETETIILPGNGAGFTIDGREIDRVAAGAQFRRTMAIENGRAVMRSSYRQLERELPAAEARAAKDAVAAIQADHAYLRTPATYQMAQSEREAVMATRPTTERGYTDRGYQLMFDGKLVEATADFDQAIAVAPQSARGHANRALSLIHRNQLEQAEASLSRASSLGGENDFVVNQAYGLLNLARGKPAEAAQALTRALSVEPDNTAALASRASAYEQLGRTGDAMADLDRSLELEPVDAGALERKALLAAFRGEESLAMATADKLSALPDRKAFGLSVKARLLHRFGKNEAAIASFREAIAAADIMIAGAADEKARNALMRDKASLLIDNGQAPEAVRLASAMLRGHPDSVDDLNIRCWSRALANSELEAAARDCDLALKAEPDNAAFSDSRAWVKLRQGRLDQAIADFDAALRVSPRLGPSLYGRGLAKLRKGDKEGGERDLAEARRIDFDVDSLYKRYGLVP